MIVITGAAGFIGSCLASRLNQDGFKDIVLVDDFAPESKKANWERLQYSALVNRSDFFDWAKGKENLIQFIFHIGARTDTTEFDTHVLNQLNFEYSKQIWQLCVEGGIPLVYASSAATYGMGEYGFDESYEQMPNLKPLNPYGQSKLDFDLWAIQQTEQPFFWAGFKFFNVYGPNEYHKGRMASVILHAYNQISEHQQLKLFKSHRSDFADGEQKRDFVYVKDLINVLIYFMHNRKYSGIYNLGSGTANTFNDLAAYAFKALNQVEQIEYVDTPLDIRDKYQYYTCANMSKLYSIGYPQAFTSLEEGVKDYVCNYLMKGQYY
jgi:ADP-L-glycero-D-manno-heptose 6-epimerase